MSSTDTSPWNPHRGQRSIYRTRADVRAETIKTNQLAERLIECWSNDGNGTGIVLATEVRTRTLYWRTTQQAFGKQQKVTTDSDLMQELVGRLEPAALKVLAQYETRRLCLNHRIEANSALSKVLDRYESNEALAAALFGSDLVAPYRQKPFSR